MSSKTGWFSERARALAVFENARDMRDATMPALIPFSCAVYTKSKACHPYTFSHVHTHGMDKGLPDTLCAEDLRAYDPRHTLQRALRAPVVVLVAGDVAQTVSAEGERSARFLYAGSEYDAKNQSAWTQYEELEAGFISLMFYGSATIYSRSEDGATRRVDVLPFEAGVVILPKRWPVAEQAMLGKCMKWAKRAVTKAAHDSLWWVEGKDATVYSEATLRIKPKRAWGQK